MGKYVHLIKINLSLITTYRFELFFAWIYRAFSFIVYYSLWSLTVTTVDERNKLILYFALFNLIFEPLGSGKMAKSMSKAIHSGEVNNFLLKPLNFPLFYLIKLLTRILIKITVPIIIFVIISIIYPGVFAPVSFVNFIFFIIFIILGLIMWNLFMTIMGSLSFWGTEIGSFLTVIDLSLNMLTGKYIPAYLFPENIQTFLSYTPIPYLASFQISIYQNDLADVELLKGFIVCGSWILILFMSYKIVFNKGLKAFDALGS